MVLRCKGFSQEPQCPIIPESTAVLKIPLHCDGCISKVEKIIKKINGVDDVTVDKGKDLVTVKGIMDVKELVLYLKYRLNRKVELVPAKKDDGGEKKDVKADGGEKKDAKADGGENKDKEAAEKGGEQKQKEAPAAAGGGDAPNLDPPPPTNCYDTSVYGPLVYAPQIFSDENPNACSIM